MTTPPPAPTPAPDSGDLHWEGLVQRARLDRPGPIDLAALLHATRHAAAVAASAPASFLTDFAALFASPRALTACAVATLACTALAGWQTWTTWQELGPLAEFAAATWEIGL